MNGSDPELLSREAALARLEAYVDAARRAEQVFRELLECRHAASVQARAAGVSIARIARELGVSRQTLTEALARRDDAAH